MNYSTHCFSVELATKVGLREAIVLQHLYWWHQHNAPLQNMNIDGRVWFFLPASQIAEVFPYLSEKVVRGILDRLVEQGYIVKDHKGEGQQKFNRTNWYALTNSALVFFHLPVWENGNPEEGKSIVISKEDNKKDNKNNPLNNIPLPYSGEEFTEVWNTLCRQPKWKTKSADALKAQADFLADYPEAVAVKMMRNSIRNGWQGLFPLKENDQPRAERETAQSRAHEAFLRVAKETGVVSKFLNINVPPES